MGVTGPQAPPEPHTLPLVEMPRQVLQPIGGRYIVERELGRGGMDVVLLARDEKLVGARFVSAWSDRCEHRTETRPDG